MKLFLLPLLLLFTGCGGELLDELNDDITVSASNCSSMECINVPQGFDWSMSKSVILKLQIEKDDGTPIRNQEVKIYNKIPLGSSTLPDNPGLIYSGTTNDDGSLTVHHRVSKGSSHLTITFYEGGELTFASIIYNEDLINIHNKDILAKVVR